MADAREKTGEKTRSDRQEGRQGKSATEKGKKEESKRYKSKLAELEQQLKESILKNPSKSLDYKLVTQLHEEVTLLLSHLF